MPVGLRRSLATSEARRRIAAIVAKELAELRAAPGVLTGGLVMLAAALAVPFGVAIGIPRWTGETLSDAEDLLELARATVPAADGLGAEATVQAFLLGQFLPLLVLVPVIAAMAIVTTSVVDELQGRSLEPLLATPITTLELIVAKAAAAFVVSLVLLAAGVVAFALLTLALAERGVLAALADARAVALLAGLAPAAAALAATLGVVVSSRARDARGAQQYGVVIVLPLVGLFLGQLAGGAAVGAPLILASAAVAWLATAGCAVLGVRLFDRERILTRWTE